ncbi:hypothetical protein LINPERPRIM_LOCUS35187 [Linum perenne]
MITATVPKTANQMTDGHGSNILAVRHYNSSFVCILLK